MEIIYKRKVSNSYYQTELTFFLVKIICFLFLLSILIVRCHVRKITIISNQLVMSRVVSLVKKLVQIQNSTWKMYSTYYDNIVSLTKNISGQLICQHMILEKRWPPNKTIEFLFFLSNALSYIPNMNRKAAVFSPFLRLVNINLGR